MPPDGTCARDNAESGLRHGASSPSKSSDAFGGVSGYISSFLAVFRAQAALCQSCYPLTMLMDMIEIINLLL